MNWRWTAKKVAISAFLIFHLAMVAVINLPDSFLKVRLWPVAIHYLLPIGLDQAWGMFAPNPVMHTMHMEVMTVDSLGVQRVYAFPRMEDFDRLQAVPRVRHSKFASNCSVEGNRAHREFAVRHAIRQLDIPREAFPVSAQLVYQVRETPPLGQGKPDRMKPPVARTLDTYRYPSIAEVNPW